MPNLLPIAFIVLASSALVFTLLWLWQSLRHAFVHTLAAPKHSEVISPERATLLAEKHTLLLALKDLENERVSGKLSGDDYDELNEQYRKRAREVLRQLDALIGPHRGRAKELLSGLAQADAPQPVAAAVLQPTAAVSTCSSCGLNNDTDATFCKKCGTRLRTEAMV